MAVEKPIGFIPEQEQAIEQMIEVEGNNFADDLNIFRRFKSTVDDATKESAKKDTQWCVAVVSWFVCVGVMSEGTLPSTRPRRPSRPPT